MDVNVATVRKKQMANDFFYEDAQDIIPFNMVARISVQPNSSPTIIRVKLVNGDAMNLDGNAAKNFLKEYRGWTETQ